MSTIFNVITIFHVYAGCFTIAVDFFFPFLFTSGNAPAQCAVRWMSFIVNGIPMQCTVVPNAQNAAMHHNTYTVHCGNMCC